MIAQDKKAPLLVSRKISEIQVHKLRRDEVFTDDRVKKRRNAEGLKIICDDMLMDWYTCSSPIMVLVGKDKLELISGMTIYTLLKANGYHGAVRVIYLANLKEGEIRKIILMDVLFKCTANDNRRFIEIIKKITLSKEWLETLEYLVPDLLRSDSDLARYLQVSPAYVSKIKRITAKGANNE